MRREKIQEMENYVRPQKAARKMRMAMNMEQTVYIYGISGMGKTAFIRNFLEEGTYQYYEAEKLHWGELKLPKYNTEEKRIIVIDNLHEITWDEIGDTIRSEIIELIEREDIWVILSGRAPLPSWLKSVHIRQFFCVIPEEDLAFTEENARKYFDMWGITFSEEDWSDLFPLLQGTPVSARVVAILMNGGLAYGEELKRRTALATWDNLEHHVYNQWDMELQEFLMEISIVDKFDYKLAEMITGKSNVEYLLQRTKEIGNFLTIERSETDTEIYRFRRQMLQSMRRRMKRLYTKEERERVYHNAGLYYELQDQPLLALDMYEEIGDMGRISNLLISNARKAPNAGHYFELKKYYLELPEEKILESPELMAGMSMLQSLLMNIEESERWYGELEKYRDRVTGSSKRTARGKLVELDIALPHRGSVDILKLLKNASLLLLDRKITLPEFSITSNLPSQMNGGKDFCEWTKKDRELAKTIGKIAELVLGKYGKGLINLGLGESMFEKGEDDYEVVTLLSRGKMQAEAGGKLEQEFVGVGMQAWVHLLHGKAEDAKEILERFKKKVEEQKDAKFILNIDTFLARAELYQGDVTKINAWFQSAPDEGMEFCVFDRFRYLTKVRVYLSKDKNGFAYELLQKMLYYAEVQKRTYIEMEAKLLLAITQYRMGNGDWDGLLKEVLTKAEEYHFVRIITREGAAVSKLLKETTWQPRDKAFWKQVLDETESMVRYYPGYLKAGVDEVVLSENAKNILRLQAEGLSRGKIAEQLGLTVENVKYHTKQTYKKLGAKDKASAVMEAKKRGII